MVRWAKLQSVMSSFFMMLHAKNYQNQSMFYGVIQKIKVARFFIETRCIRVILSQSILPVVLLLINVTTCVVYPVCVYGNSIDR